MSLGTLPWGGRTRDLHTLADTLVGLGYAHASDLDALTDGRHRSVGPIGAALVDAGVVTDEQFAHALAVAGGFEYVDAAQTVLDVAAAALITRSAAAQYEAVPIGFDADGRLRVAVADPTNAVALGEIGLGAGLDVQAVIVSPAGLQSILQRLEGLEATPVDDRSAPSAEQGSDLVATGDEAPTVRLVHSVIADAVAQRASDIHFELEADELRVKFRIDGMLVRATTVPASMGPGVVSRLKIMADLDIAERRAPQDGRIHVRLPGRRLDLRIVTIPVVGGEAVVLRILEGAGAASTFEEIGLEGTALTRMSAALTAAHGAVLVTGPTGSGKTTTLYAALQRLNSGERAIITVEDPVEYQVSNAKQVQVNAHAGVTFGTALRTLMRTDPDIVMIGEIRDHETARIGIEAALTGHLVLSTLHTNDAASAIVRLGEMGVEPYLVASAVHCVAAQRLVRRLCESCRQPVLLSAETLRACGFETDEEIEAWRPEGCIACTHTGYRGRGAIFEVMFMDPPIRKLALAGADADSIAEEAVRLGMTTLRQDAMRKLRAGQTSLEEVTRVLGGHR